MVKITRSLTWVSHVDDSSYYDVDDNHQMSEREIREWEENLDMSDILESLEYVNETYLHSTLRVEFEED